jgi:hypothetical protein
MNQPFFLHDKARPHTILRKSEASAKRGGLFCSFPLPPELAPSDFHIFASMKVPLRGRRFAEDDHLQHSVHQNLRHFSQEFDATSIHPFMQCKNCVDNEA